ncbi:hypothetical protein [Calothrix sp. NIES-2100]
MARLSNASLSWKVYPLTARLLTVTNAHILADFPEYILKID